MEEYIMVEITETEKLDTGDVRVKLNFEGYDVWLTLPDKVHKRLYINYIS
jgi:hypothetical protein